MRTFKLIIQHKNLFLKKSNLFGSIKQFKLPDLGEKIKEATIKQWHVKEGDIVEEYQELADVATDKLFTTIPSEYAGKIHKIMHKEEETCLVGDVLVEIELKDGITAESSVEKRAEYLEDKEHHPSKQILQNIQNKTLATPSVRNLIKQNNLDIDKIVGSGEQGRILKQDVQDFMNIKTQTKETVPLAPTPLKSTSSKVVQMNPYEKGMYKSMTQSNTIPHFYLMEEIDITELANLRQNFKEQTKQNITFMPLFIKAFSIALSEYPIINSTYDVSTPFEYKMHNDHNISIAIDSPNGLVVPNIKGCQNLSMIKIQEEMNRLRDLSQASKVGPNDLSNGTFCVSNVGNIGGTYTGPKILPPQVCIVAIGKMQELPRYVTKNNKTKLKPRKIINVSFGCDHRILNGATVARFVKKWKELIENPTSFIMNMK